ncbi:ribonuclease H2 subunit B [Brevipalpus obovatus]|uniref:ribonuclease H2 subunit B n=1 Tax=Brevipalpus obovatus TaxID=246614 RepID=UPI003D9F653C
MSKSSAQVVIVPSGVKEQQLTSLQISSSTVEIPFAGDLFIDEKGFFYEVVRYKEDCRSWFCGNMVVSNGSLLMLTPIDTLFLAVPFLLAKRNHFCCLYDLLSHESSAQKIFCGLTSETVNLELVADKMKVCGETHYRFNEDKSIKWLKCKIMNIITVLKKIGINVLSTKSSVKGYRSGRIEDIDIKHYQRYALDFLRSYVPNELVEILHQNLKLGEEDESMENKEYSVKEEEMDSNGGKRPLDDSDSSDLKGHLNGNSLKKEKDFKKHRTTKAQGILKREAKMPGQPTITGFLVKKSPLKSEIKKEIVNL